LSRQISKNTLHLITLLFVFCPFRFVASQTNQQPGFYEQGIAKRDSGNWQAALDIWLAGYDSLKLQKPDARLGLTFMELIAPKTHLLEFAFV